MQGASPRVHPADSRLKPGQPVVRAAYMARYKWRMRPVSPFFVSSPAIPQPRRAPPTKRVAPLRILLAAMAMGACMAAHAQSVQPNRYGTPPPASSSDSLYQRQQQANEDARRIQQEASRRAERDRVGVAIDANRQKMESDRARTERQRAAAADPAESERLRQEYEQRRQAYEREREELERQRAQASPNPEPARP